MYDQASRDLQYSMDKPVPEPVGTVNPALGPADSVPLYRSTAKFEVPKQPEFILYDR